MSIKSALITAYKRYGFSLIRETVNGDVLVFTLKTGYFDNAEIIKFDKHTDTNDLFNEFSTAGYACTVKTAEKPEQVEEELFNGFFSVQSTRKRLIEEYNRFANALVKPYGGNAKYEYIKAPYHIDGKEGQNSPPEEVLSRINEDKPILFLIEAAAGFGKTCTAQEIAKLLTNNTNRLSFYAELSRNRQARIFRYILLDEIDRTFPLLNSNLVQTEIKKGRISVILDGFDELLRKNEDAEDFDKKEPMLETVSELLAGRAKIIITTRRTVLFDGDKFHQWLEQHSSDFSVVRIRIQEPKINDWLPYNRIEALKNAGLNIEIMANPVLLSYLRCINDEQFSLVSSDPERIVQSYFEYMLDRERERQDLRMTPEMQSEILKTIADDMIRHEYTAEERDYIVKILLEKCVKQIEAARNQYPASEKPSREEIANKLASHALLDRNSIESTKIGFVNDFSLGNYVAEIIISDSNWLGDDLRFIEPAIRSYAPRTETSKRKLYEGLENSLPYLDTLARIEVSSKLINEMPSDLEKNSHIDGVELSLIEIGNPSLSSCLFNEVTFKRCKLIKSGLNQTTFINCRFFECEVMDDDVTAMINILGCTSSPEITHILNSHQNRNDITPPTNREHLIEKHILKRFWPTGEPLNKRPSRPIYKPIKHLCQHSDEFSSAELFHGIERLIKIGILNAMNRSSLITLNFEKLSMAYKIFEEYI